LGSASEDADYEEVDQECGSQYEEPSEVQAELYDLEQVPGAAGHAPDHLPSRVSPLYGAQKTDADHGFDEQRRAAAVARRNSMQIEAVDEPPLGAVGAWSADAVTVWLRAEGLSEAVLAEFEGTAGSDLVLLTAEDMTGAGIRMMQAKALVRKINALAMDGGANGGSDGGDPHLNRSTTPGEIPPPPTAVPLLEDLYASDHSDDDDDQGDFSTAAGAVVLKAVEQRTGESLAGATQSHGLW
jgi:hypothetical protein